jgi:hypothetical protein
MSLFRHQIAGKNRNIKTANAFFRRKHFQNFGTTVTYQNGIHEKIEGNMREDGNFRSEICFTPI